MVKINWLHNRLRLLLKIDVVAVDAGRGSGWLVGLYVRCQIGCCCMDIMPFLLLLLLLLRHDC